MQGPFFVFRLSTKDLTSPLRGVRFTRPRFQCMDTRSEIKVGHMWPWKVRWPSKTRRRHSQGLPDDDPHPCPLHRDTCMRAGLWRRRALWESDGEDGCVCFVAAPGISLLCDWTDKSFTICFLVSISISDGYMAGLVWRVLCGTLEQRSSCMSRTPAKQHGAA